MSDHGDAGEATTLVVTGAGGRMGREVIDAAAERADVRVVGAINRTDVGDDLGISVEPPSELPQLLGRDEPDVIVDFTAPEATVEYAAAAAEQNVAFLTGTTGLDDSDRAVLAEAAESVPVLAASNFSRGVAALRRAVAAAVESLPSYDIEVTETHHDGKQDAPSGTAETIVSDIEDARPDLDSRQHGRSGVEPRESDEIGVHARRAGDIAGEHEVLLAGDENVLSLSHRAGSRHVFAAGALDAAAWLPGQSAGEYDFDDVLDTTATTDDTTVAGTGGEHR